MSNILNSGMAQQLMQQQQTDYNKYIQQMYSQVVQPYGISGSMLGALTQAAPARTEPEGKTVICVGPYKLKDTGKAFHLYHGLDAWVASWSRKQMPSREVLASAIRFHRACRPRVNKRDPVDGSLMGIRYFILTDDYHLQSPQQKTVWESSTLSVPTWDESEAVRGVCGIHACWPSWNGVMQPHIDMECKDGVMAQVRGYGKYVAGKEGWRAEKVIVDTVYLPPTLVNRWRVVKRFSRLYPEISFEEEPWTLERSSRSGK